MLTTGSPRLAVLAAATALTAALTSGPAAQTDTVLLEALDDLPRVGFLQVDGGLSWDLHFARRIPGENGGERVIVATDRPVSFWEAGNQPLSLPPTKSTTLSSSKTTKRSGSASHASPPKNADRFPRFNRVRNARDGGGDSGSGRESPPIARSSARKL